MALWQAIEQYHELLTGDIAAESQGQLVAQQERRGLYFGDRPLATVLRPRFMAPEQYRHLESRVRVVLRAFQSLVEYDRRSPPTWPPGLSPEDVREYGDTRVAFLRAPSIEGEVTS